MKSHLRITKHDGGRAAVEIEIQLDQAEIDAMESNQCPRHVDTPDSIPCQFHQTPNPKERTVQGMPTFNGQPVRGYILPKARRVPLNRPMVGKSLLRMFFPGTMGLGYINEREIPNFEIWWKKVQEHLKVQLKELIFNVSDNPDFIPAETIEVSKEEKLNPFSENETKGVRRRSFDDF